MKGGQPVLVVDDEPKILELVKSYLEINGYTVFRAASGREGMEIFERNLDSKNPVSLILLDLMLPDFSGEEFCRKVRRESDVPIIMITAKVDEESIVRGLNIGADDYVCKPFSPRQLVARVGAALRRRGGEKPGGFLSCGDLSIDTEKRILRRRGEEVALTRDEYRILSLLMSRRAKIFTREEILEATKGDDYEGFDRSVDSHIKRLRVKIGDDPRAPKYILTVYGMGYRLGDCCASQVKPSKIADEEIFYPANSVEPKVRSTPDNRDFCVTGSAKTRKSGRLLGDDS
ncbi:MAG: response regulator transcription factor [Treponema sp.]|jgi:DNA-binding response OmpR family regulator|nr:response regulator transcription factor [Treponema sp.]